MSNRHLPAGQGIQAAAGGINGGMDLNGNMGGPRRRQQQYMNPYHQHQLQNQHPQHMNHMYSNYAPYAPQQYYGMPPHQYQTGGVPAPGYMPYQNYNTRSPPPMQQYAPMVGVSIPPSYPRASPNPMTPYQPPLAPAPGLPHTPSSTHSSQLLPPPTPTTPQTPPVVQPAPVPVPVQETTPAPAPVAPSPVVAPVVESREPFRPPVSFIEAILAEICMSYTNFGEIASLAVTPRRRISCEDSAIKTAEKAFGCRGQGSIAAYGAV